MPVKPLGSHPVHDLGFVGIPKEELGSFKIEEELEFAPELLETGMDARLLSNDAGKKVTTAIATINGFDYSPGSGDMNIAYAAAAFSSGAGSSGGPVINIAGKVVAMKTYHVGRSIDCLLPVDLMPGLLHCMRNGKQFVTGTDQVRWNLLALHEAEVRDLPGGFIDNLRDELKIYNVISADRVLPNGPADGKIEVGDILLNVKDEAGNFLPTPKDDLMLNLTKLESVMNSNVGNTLRFTVWRGSEEVEVQIRIQNLPDICQRRLLELGNAVFSELPFEEAMMFNRPVGGVWVVRGSGPFQGDMLLKSVENQPTPDLDTLVDVMNSLPQRTHLQTTHEFLTNIGVLTHSGTLLPLNPSKGAVMMKCKTIGGPWEKVWEKPVFPSSLERPTPSAQVSMPSPEAITFRDATTIPAKIKAVFDSMVWYSTAVFGYVENHINDSESGFGAVIDEHEGLALVSRNELTNFTDVSLTIAGQREVRAWVLGMLPLNNFAVLKYDPKDPKLANFNVQAIKLAEEPLRLLEKITFTPFHNIETLAHKSAVISISDVTFPVFPHSAFFRPNSAEHILLEPGIDTRYPLGAMLKDDGAVAALRLGASGSVSCCIQAPQIRNITKLARDGQLGSIRVLDFHTCPTEFISAINRGLPGDEIGEMSKRQLMKVEAVPLHVPSLDARPGEPQQHPLELGDIVLKIDGKSVSGCADIPPYFPEDVTSVKVSFLRHRKVNEVSVHTIPASLARVDSFVSFCGATVHKPNLGVLQNCTPVRSQIYVSAYTHGSPAQNFKLSSGAYITGIKTDNVKANDPPPAHLRKLTTLDDFLEAVRDLDDGTWFWLQLYLNNTERKINIRKNTRDFPTLRCVAIAGGRWEMSFYDSKSPRESFIVPPLES